MRYFKARPDAPAWARAWPELPGAIALVTLVAGAVYASLVVDSHGARLMWLGGAVMAASSVVGLWRSALQAVRSTREFDDQHDADRAAQIYGELRRVGLGFLAAEAWDHLARASRAGLNDEFNALIGQLRDMARRYRAYSADADVIREFTEHCRALERKLGGDPKELT